jgi:metallo-beta-lactamase class B
MRSLFIPLLLLLTTLCGRAQAAEPACTNCALWNTPQKPIRIYGNTYYVGPHGLSAILVTSSAGHILIDAALPESAPLIAANIRALGFRVGDVKIILSTHVHFDHAGGIAELQRLTGATVMASPWSAAVLSRGGVDPADPQFGDIRGIAPVANPAANLKALTPGETVHLGQLALTSHPTPGHTPGGTSWTWTSCEGDRCYNMVYADSVTAVAPDSFKFTHNARYPNSIADFERSFAFLDTVPCDVLLTAHPDASDLWEKLARRRAGTTPDPLVEPGACKALAQRGRTQLQQRIAKETAK